MLVERPRPPKVLLVEDHPLVVRGLIGLLRDELAGCEIAQVATAEEAIRAIDAGEVDVVLVDLHLPGTRGLEVIRHAVSSPKPPASIVISVETGTEHVVEALRAGARGYVSKGSDPEHIGKAIRSALRGARYLSPDLAAKVAEYVVAPRSDPEPRHRLTERETLVARRLAQGERVSDIARELGLSTKTVSTYRTRALDKLGLRTNAELVRYAMNHPL